MTQCKPSFYVTRRFDSTQSPLRNLLKLMKISIKSERQTKKKNPDSQSCSSNFLMIQLESLLAAKIKKEKGKKAAKKNNWLLHRHWRFRLCRHRAASTSLRPRFRLVLLISTFFERRFCLIHAHFRFLIVIKLSFWRIHSIPVL